MLTHLQVRNVREAYARGIQLITFQGIEEDSRNGPCLVMPGPLITSYARPQERVLLDPSRDANPFFHLMEAFWMLAGRRDVASIGQYAGQLKTYSDDGEVFHGAYGHRWRHHFTRPGAVGSMEIDQLQEVIRLLRADRTDRRIVLQMWDPSADLGLSGLDFPCNNLCYFRVRNITMTDGINHSTAPALDMTLACRSNDMLWGGWGANAVHFSVLQEFVASMLGVRVGEMHQISNNAHLYRATMPSQMPTLPASDYGPTVPLFGDLSAAPIGEVFDDLDCIWDDPVDAEVEWLPNTTLQLVGGIRLAWSGWKAKIGQQAMAGIDQIADSGHADWAQACSEWIMRREDKLTW